MAVTARTAFALLLGTLWTGLALALTPYLVDGDGDAVSDEIDECPYTQPGVQVNRLGCPLRRDDGDVDGVVDDEDQCPYTTKGAKVDEKGCALDSDFDGVADGLDRCPSTPLAAMVNAVGCAATERASAVSLASSLPEPAAKVVLGPIPPRPEPASEARAGGESFGETPLAVRAEQPKLEIRFNAGSARLGRGDRALLKAYAKVFLRRLAADNSRRLMVRSLADHRESQAEDALLARAAAVRAALIDLGIPADRIDTDNKLLSSGEAAQNRRVEIGFGG